MFVKVLELLNYHSQNCLYMKNMKFHGMLIVSYKKKVIAELVTSRSQ